MIPAEFQLNFLAGNLEKQKSLLGVRIDLFPSVASYKTLKKWKKRP